MIFFVLFLLISIILEATLVSFPLTLMVLVASTFTLKKDYILVFAGVSGLILDVLLLRTIGLSAITFLFLIFLLFLYERKMQPTNIVVFVTSFIAGLVYLFIGGNNSFVATLLCSALAVLLFNFMNKLHGLPRQEKKLRFEV